MGIKLSKPEPAEETQEETMGQTDKFDPPAPPLKPHTYARAVRNRKLFFKELEKSFVSLCTRDDREVALFNAANYRVKLVRKDATINITVKLS